MRQRGVSGASGEAKGAEPLSIWTERAHVHAERPGGSRALLPRDVEINVVLVRHCVFVLKFPVLFSVHTLCATQNQTKSIIREILIQINLQIMLLKGVKLCILGDL